MRRVGAGVFGGAVLLGGISAQAAVPPLVQLPDRQLQTRSANMLGNELLRRNATAPIILRVRELTSKYLSGGSDKDFSPQVQVAVAEAPPLLGPGIECRSLRLRLDLAFPTNWLPALVIDGPWCLTQTGWQATTLRVSGAIPKVVQPLPWDNHGQETTTLVVTPTQGQGAALDPLGAAPPDPQQKVSKG